MSDLKLQIPWFVWKFRVNIREIFHEIHLFTNEDSRLDGTHLPRRLCSGIQAGSAMFYLSSTSGLSVVEAGLSSPLQWEVSRPTLDDHFSGGKSGQLSPRSPSVADERVKVQSKSWMSNAETCKYNAKVGCGKRKLKGQMLNVGCKKVNVHSTELEGRIRKLDCCLWKVDRRKRKLECCVNQSRRLNVECKKVESRVETQITNTKCRIDFAKYDVKWNIEFWQKWSAIHPQNNFVTRRVDTGP